MGVASGGSWFPLAGVVDVTGVKCGGCCMVGGSHWLDILVSVQLMVGGGCYWWVDSSVAVAAWWVVPILMTPERIRDVTC